MSLAKVAPGEAGLDAARGGELRSEQRTSATRKKLTEVDETLVDDLELHIAPETRGDPESLLRWTTKSVRKHEQVEAKGRATQHPRLRWPHDR
jgi:hypothetical protein